MWSTGCYEVLFRDKTILSTNVSNLTNKKEKAFLGYHKSHMPISLSKNMEQSKSSKAFDKLIHITFHTRKC